MDLVTRLIRGPKPRNVFCVGDVEERWCKPEKSGNKYFGRKSSGHSERGEAGSVPASRVATDKECFKNAAKIKWDI